MDTLQCILQLQVHVLFKIQLEGPQNPLLNPYLISSCYLALVGCVSPSDFPALSGHVSGQPPTPATATSIPNTPTTTGSHENGLRQPTAPPTLCFHLLCVGLCSEHSAGHHPWPPGTFDNLPLPRTATIKPPTCPTSAP